MRISFIKGFYGMSVNICAKGLNKDKCNRDDAGAVWNKISMWAMEAADSYRRRGADALANDAERVADEIYRFLKEEGIYE